MVGAGKDRTADRAVVAVLQNDLGNVAAPFRGHVRSVAGGENSRRETGGATNFRSTERGDRSGESERQISAARQRLVAGQHRKF